MNDHKSLDICSDVGSLWAWAREQFMREGGLDEWAAREESAQLLAHVLETHVTTLYTHPEKKIDPLDVERFSSFVAQRLQGVPTAYLTGHRGFWSLELQVSPAVLVPRPETECLVEAALKWVTQQDARVLDLGTGSGALPLALAVERPQWILDAVDQSAEALEVAQQNAALILQDRESIHFYQGSWFSALQAHSHLSYDLVISNPPYLSEEEWQSDPRWGLSDLTHEPKLALVAGKTGLGAYQDIIPGAVGYLKPGGWLILEHGWTQQEAVIDLLRDQPYEMVEKGRDHAGLPRYVVARRF